MKDRKELSNETCFFLYLLETYAEYRKKNAVAVLKQFDDSHLTAYINDMYQYYHTERLENAFEDIDRKLAEILDDSVETQTEKMTN